MLAEANKTKYDQSQIPLGGVRYPCVPAFCEAFSQEKNTWLTEEWGSISAHGKQSETFETFCHNVMEFSCEVWLFCFLHLFLALIGAGVVHFFISPQPKPATFLGELLWTCATTCWIVPGFMPRCVFCSITFSTPEIHSFRWRNAWPSSAAMKKALQLNGWHDDMVVYQYTPWICFSIWWPQPKPLRLGAGGAEDESPPRQWRQESKRFDIEWVS